MAFTYTNQTLGITIKCPRAKDVEELQEDYSKRHLIKENNLLTLPPPPSPSFFLEATERTKVCAKRGMILRKKMARLEKDPTA